ncbi:MAG TPA: hypothetical protein VIL99_04735 [Ignavibacteria bacterium]
MKIIIILFILSININIFAQEFPYTVKISEGKYNLVFSDKQQKAINDYLNTNNNLTLLLDDNYNEDIEYYMNSGLMQHRYAAWGDFNKDSFQDFMLLFVYSDISQNPYHPKGYVYNLVIFEGKSDGLYSPIVIHKEKNGIIDGVTYDKVNNIIEFSCFGVAAGLIERVGEKYKVTEMMGD